MHDHETSPSPNQPPLLLKKEKKAFTDLKNSQLNLLILTSVLPIIQFPT